MNKDPLEDISDRDAQKLTACAQRISELWEQFPGCDPVRVEGYTEQEIAEAKALLHRMGCEAPRPKASRKLKGGTD